MGDGASRARQIRAAASVLGELQSVTDVTLLPVNEAQARPLAALEDAAQRATAWERAIQIAEGQPTTNDVKRAVEELQAFIQVRRYQEEVENVRKEVEKVRTQVERGQKLLDASRKAIAFMRRAKGWSDNAAPAPVKDLIRALHIYDASVLAPNAPSPPLPARAED